MPKSSTCLYRCSFVKENISTVKNRSEILKQKKEEVGLEVNTDKT